MTKSELLKQYSKLAKKLGKLPTYREVQKFICSERQVCNIFGKFNVLKSEALEQYPWMVDLAIPALLGKVDVEMYKLNIEKAKNVKHNKKLVKDVTTLEYIERYAESIFNGKIKPTSILKSKGPIKRALNLTLSDLHFGADIKKTETGYEEFGTLEEARRFATIIDQTIKYKPQYRKQTELHVNLLGDIIQNKLHDAQDAAPIAEQVCRAIHLLSQGLAQLSEAFPKVTVHCAVGNHGRDTARHHGRAVSGKWDSLETVIYYALKKALSNYKNLTFDLPKTPYCIYEVFGHKMFTTHGDTVLSIGNPGKSLNIAKIENLLNKFNSTLKDQDEVKIAIVGHTHCASVSVLTNGTTLVTNGALPPPDQFAVSIGILEGQSSQTLFETVPEYPLGDIRFIRVSSKDNENVEMDKIIKPWKEF